MTMSSTTKINNSQEPGVSASSSSSKEVPAGYTVHREGTAEVLLAEGRDVFINPIQEFNRDLSTLAIRTWSEIVNDEKRKKWERKKQAAVANKNKKRKHEDVADVQEQSHALNEDDAAPAVKEVGMRSKCHPYTTLIAV